MTEAPDQKLDVLAEVAAQAGANSIALEARDLQRRSEEGRYFVACVGQFKRGKSTVLNALVGMNVLPTGVIPVTTVVTVVRYGDRLRARLRIRGDAWKEIPPSALIAYVAEDLNPGNRKGVTAVEVFAPSPILESGMCLVDTPGVGSVFAANTEATRAFVPHIDAAIVVLGADPPISGEELRLVQEISPTVSELVFVMNKSDRLGEEERREASAFAQRVLTERLGRPVPLPFAVSATERLTLGSDTRDWARLQGALEQLASSGTRLVRSARDRGTRLLADHLGDELDAQRSALVQPLAESERQLEALRVCIADALRASRDLTHLFDSEQEALCRTLVLRKERYLEAIVPVATAALESRVKAAEERRGPPLRRRAYAIAQELARQHVEAWIREIEPFAEVLYQKATARFVDLTVEFLERIARIGAPQMSRVARPLDTPSGFQTKTRFYFHELVMFTGGTPLVWVLDHLRTRSQALHAITRDANVYLTKLLVVNGTRVENDLHERMTESRRRHEHEVQKRLRDVADSANRTMENARSAHAQGAEAVRVALATIDALRDRIAPMRSPSEGMPTSP